MRRFQAIVFGASRLAAQVAAVLMAYMVLHVLVEIVLRAFFDTSTYVLDEFIGYAVAGVVFLSLAYSFQEGALIRVNLVLTRIHGLVRRGLEIFCVSATLAVTVFLGSFFWRDWLRAFDRGEISPSIAGVPMWIPLGLVLLGYILFTFQLIAYLISLFAGGREIQSEITGK